MQLKPCRTQGISLNAQIEQRTIEINRKKLSVSELVRQRRNKNYLSCFWTVLDKKRNEHILNMNHRH